MRKGLLILVLSFNGLVAYSQKIEMLDQSAFKHNYAVSCLAFIEDLKDTARLNYMATIKISGLHDSVPKVLAWLNLLQMRAKPIGANAYYVLNYSETETTASLTIKLYFAGTKFFTINEQKRDTNRVFVFNQTRTKNDSASFYLNGKRKAFYSRKYYTINAALNQECSISVNNNSLTTTNIVFKKRKKSRFYILPTNKKNLQVGSQQIVGNPVGLAIRPNSFYELDYDAGRLLAEVYK